MTTVKAYIAPKAGPRYVAKHANGQWTVFDTVYFGAARPARTEKDANDQAADLNLRHAAKVRK